MKVKFTLDDMTGIDGLTPGKEYEFDQSDDSITNDYGHWIIIMTENDRKNCAHLMRRAKWELVK